MPDTGPPPVIPDNLQQYNSYVVDPRYQIKFTIAWTCVLAFAIIASLPQGVRGSTRWRERLPGVMEDSKGRYARVKLRDGEEGSSRPPKKICCARPQHRDSRSNLKILAARALSTVGSWFYWSHPFLGGLCLGQVILIAAYFATVLACALHAVPLSTNSNRPAFLALAQFPPLFLFSGKASPLALIFPPQFSYTRLNFLHRWAARGVLICVTIHGSFWIASDLKWSLPILGQQKETSGIAAYGVLCGIGLASVRVVRERAWIVFHWVHFLGFPAFFITICYHTPYASPWILPPIAFYAFDLFMRSLRVRMKDALLIRVHDGMTIVYIPDCDTGFSAGQHLRLRVFFEGRGAFEAHPFSIMSAPFTGSSFSCIRAKHVHNYWKRESEAGIDKNKNARPIEEEGPAGIVLGARVAGDWTSALNAYAKVQEDRIRASSPSSSSSSVASASSPPTHDRPIPVPVQVMFDGPYGGCGLDLGTYDRVLLVAGGSGATFAIGLLDEVVGACVKNSREDKSGKKVRTNRVDFVWCIRSFGSITWFAPLLSAIAHAARGVVQLRILVYVTCLCVPEAVRDIPGMEIRVGARPDIGKLLGRVADLDTEDDGAEGGGEEVNNAECCGCGCIQELLEDEKAQEELGGERGKEKEDPEKAVRGLFRGKVALCASGPLSLTRDAANAVVRYAGRGDGRVEFGLHTEVFAI